jgi:hypothetical protein
MSKPKNKNSAGAEERAETREPTISLAHARRMIPLVQQIVGDIQLRWNQLSDLESEQMDLDRRRRELDWPRRKRRYQIADDINREQVGLQDAVGELEHLNVILVDPMQGEVAFPTSLNGRRGYYIWRAGHKDVGWWCYAHDPTRHALPAGR